MLIAILLATWQPHFSLSAGGGLAYGIGGVHAEARIGPFAIFAATGIDFVSHSWARPLVYAAGARACSFGLLEENSGPVISAHVASVSAYQHGDVSTGEYMAFDDLYFAGTLGWRQRIQSGWFFEIGLGAATRRNHEYGFQSTAPSTASPQACTPPGSLPQEYCRLSRSVTADVDLAIGFEF